MKTKITRPIFSSCLTLVVVMAMLSVLSVVGSAQTETVLYNFPRVPASAFYTVSGLVRDSSGNLYGTNRLGGTPANSGAVFKLAPDGTATIVHDFGGVGDAVDPHSGVVMDERGNLYGTTENDGDQTYLGYGSIFSLSPGNVEKLLYSFLDKRVGAYPSPLLYYQGAIYGTTLEGYASTLDGTIFEISSGGTFRTLYKFKGGLDGTNPNGPLVRDTEGNLYGTTMRGGEFANGTVFKLTPAGEETVLYSFSGGADGGQPNGGLLLGRQGTLYGTTSLGGHVTPSGICLKGCGVVFQVSQDGTETVLHSFDGQRGGAFPYAGLVRDPHGNFYGTTTEGGDISCRPLLGGPITYLHGCGTAFELASGGKYTVLHKFGLGPGDGYYPTTGLVLDPDGNAYGTTWLGGTAGFGMVYQITP